MRGKRQPKGPAYAPLIHAAMQADAMLEKGDLDGRAVWLRIIGAIEELLRGRPEPGDSIH